MTILDDLKTITTKPELAKLIKVKSSALTYTLYKLDPATLYTTFTIPKKSGGERTILAPSARLKNIQKGLSKLLLDCIDEINKAKQKEGEKYRPTLSHGFTRKGSIITNAMMHLDKKNVLNIDLADFFDSFNFGRVRGFFIKNKHFGLDPQIATVIAKIACYDNKLPQGSPCSPVITNLITHSLDIRLASLAKKHSSIYSRYADDLTFSTRERKFSAQIVLKKIMNASLGKN
ncbi:MAG: reverse transcriptase domain-containing protein [Candidatus Endonucleobacter bathymodioli]|uniref:RNA-directed DNA polymerase n=1 Tax=Candidatus Endonucleibacter bathymodioli TaxID=539814 RepID=A0AA90SY21_9GAMM|nr:reverse transcriptase domain-containing protein [Candidatus Endonucleobacter bathymodioli]